MTMAQQNITDNCQYATSFSNNSGIAITFIIIALFGSLFAVLGNLLCIITFSRTQSLHTPSNLLLGALCLTDLIMGLITQPLYQALQVVQLVTGKTIPILRRVYVSSAYLLTGWSCFSTGMISLDRYLAICHPYVYLRVVTCKKYAMISGMVYFAWALYTVIDSVSVAGESSRYLFVPSTILVFFIIVICYWRIFRVLLKQQRSIRIAEAVSENEVQNDARTKREKSKALIIALILLFFIICNLPTLVINLSFAIKRTICFNGRVFALLNFANLCLLLNSCVNPVVYCARSSEIRSAAKRIFIGIRHNN